MSLLLPGPLLHLNALLAMRKFRDRGNKAGAVRGFELLEESGLGEVITTKPPRGASLVRAYMYCTCINYNYYTYADVSVQKSKGA